MRKQLIISSLLTALVGVYAAAIRQPQRQTQRISRATLEDNIRGGWAGQMIGVSYGAPTEFKSNGRVITLIRQD